MILLIHQHSDNYDFGSECDAIKDFAVTCPCLHGDGGDCRCLVFVVSLLIIDSSYALTFSSRHQTVFCS